MTEYHQLIVDNASRTAVKSPEARIKVAESSPQFWQAGECGADVLSSHKSPPGMAPSSIPAWGHSPGFYVCALKRDQNADWINILEIWLETDDQWQFLEGCDCFFPTECSDWNSLHGNPEAMWFGGKGSVLGIRGPVFGLWSSENWVNLLSSLPPSILSFLPFKCVIEV